MKKLGSGLFVTAAFIGPGTVTTASLAGANYGYALVWALLFSVFATFILQEMASRLGMVTRSGLAEALREQLPVGVIRNLSIVLIICAIGVGNAAYQAGNLTGAALGIQQSIGGAISFWSLVIAFLAGIILLSGKHALVEKSLIGLVALMSIVFITTMFLARPDWSAMAEGLVSVSIPSGALLTVMALIGTTVVPYNLFLHASVVASQQQEVATLKHLKANTVDAAFSIGAGGLVTLAVLSCAASAFFMSGQTMTAGNIASQLEPILGPLAGYFFALGLFAAGLTSAITAPLAAAYAVSGALGWKTDMSSTRFKSIWLTIMIIGAGVASSGFKPLVAILFAQATNGLLLPIIALFLIWVMNKSSLLGEFKNSMLSNVFSIAIVIFVCGLGVYRLTGAF